MPSDKHAKDESNSIAVKFEKVTKKFRIYHSEREHMRSLISKKARRAVDTVTAMDNVSMTIERGEVVNIAGRSGSGKSTFTDLVVGSILPSKGKLYVSGDALNVTALRAIINPKLPVKDNILVAAKSLGMGKVEREAILNDVTDFAQIGNAMHSAVNAMNKAERTRLKSAFFFAVAEVAAEKANLLIFTPSIIGGDVKFKKACEERLARICSDENTTVLVESKNPAKMVLQFSRTIIFENGRIHYDGSPKDAASAYKPLAILEAKYGEGGGADEEE